MSAPGDMRPEGLCGRSYGFGRLGIQIRRSECRGGKIETHGSRFVLLVLHTNLPSSSTLYFRNGKTRW